MNVNFIIYVAFIHIDRVPYCSKCSNFYRHFGLVHFTNWPLSFYLVFNITDALIRQFIIHFVMMLTIILYYIQAFVVEDIRCCIFTAVSVIGAIIAPSAPRSTNEAPTTTTTREQLRGRRQTRSSFTRSFKPLLLLCTCC